MFNSIAKSNSKMKNSRSASAKNINKSSNKLDRTLQNSLSPNKKVIKSSPNAEQSFVNGMKKIRDKLSTTLDAHFLILQTGAPIRCLEHNSVISLYCETEQKLLCANCVYRSATHKMHKVLPVEKCIKALTRDIEIVGRQCEREVSWLEDTQKIIHSHFKDEQKLAHQVLLDLANLYEEVRYQLDKSFEEVRKKIVLSLQNLCFKQETVLLEVGFFKEIFKRNKLPTSNEMQNLNERSIMYSHSIAMTLLQFGKVEGKNLGPSTSRIKQIQRQEGKVLNEILGMLAEKDKVKQKEK